jgi:NAD(P)-dependent dehydrogenase (short-subunit alcohol dehydrogenase family)
MARDLIGQGGLVAVFDILPQEKGELLVRDSLSADRAWYFETNIADEASVQAACDGVLAAVPKGSLAGLVHCAAASKSRPWTQKMARSIADFKLVVNVNVVGTFIVNALVADAINSQYADQAADLPARVTEERGVIINVASAAATPNARVLTYGVRLRGRLIVDASVLTLVAPPSHHAPQPTKSASRPANPSCALSAPLLTPFPSSSPSSTAAVLGITTAAADYLGPCGIRVNSVSPSVVARCVPPAWVGHALLAHPD